MKLMNRKNRISNEIRLILYAVKYSPDASSKQSNHPNQQLWNKKQHITYEIKPRVMLVLFLSFPSSLKSHHGPPVPLNDYD
jgi:hypothetical protein